MAFQSTAIPSTAELLSILNFKTNFFANRIVSFLYSLSVPQSLTRFPIASSLSNLPTTLIEGLPEQNYPPHCSSFTYVC